MTLRVARTVEACRAERARWRAAGERVALVPTMGALHAGHLSLVEAARAHADRVALSIFVNPTQFDSASDLAAYPRDEARDLELAGEVGVDLAFVPTVREMYPRPGMTRVTMHGVSEGLEGAARPGHFDGVLTVVAKLFHVVQPEVAVFGQKDAQQCAVVERMVADLDFPIRIVVAPTVREPDGLALSSRNVRLSPMERTQALALWRALEQARSLFEGGETRSHALEAAMREVLDAAPGVDPEYAAVVDRAGFRPVEIIEAPAVAAIAARVGPVRLIDNLVLEPRP